LKRIVRGVFLKHGLNATFMPKPYADEPGSGTHIHVSLLKEDGCNQFASESLDPNESLRHAIGGLATTMAESMLVFAPTAKGNLRGRLTIAHSDGAPRVVELTGEAYGRAIVEVTPAQLDFGSLKPGAQAPTRTVTVSSKGSDDVRLEAPTIQGDEGFSLRSQCPQTLPPKRQCVIEIGFRPTKSNEANKPNKAR